ncbi:MAG: DUF5655 domain-containing protein [Candidatus Micrarchaeota archaeon]
MKTQWRCPKCDRSFEKEGQSHSCRIYPLARHFENKPYGKELFEGLIARLKPIGKVRIDSVECCIHLLSNYVFSGVWILRDRIRISFQLDRKVKSARFRHYLQMSANRHIYHMDVSKKKEIDGELVNWLKESFNLKKK